MIKKKLLNKLVIEGMYLNIIKAAYDKPIPNNIGKESEASQSCPTLCNPMDCSVPGSSIYGIFKARVLEWVAISFSRGYS